jgi:hypothetical protein
VIEFAGPLLSFKVAIWTEEILIPFMKSLRLFVVSAFIVFSVNANSAWAQATSDPARPGQAQAQNSSAQLPFKIGNKASRFVQNVTGITPLTQIVVSQVAKKVIQRKVGGKVKVKIRIWSLTDCLAGKIKSVDVRIKHCSFKDTRIGDVQLASSTPIWLRYKNKDGERAGLRTPVLLSMTGKVTQEDVAQALKNTSVASSLRGLKLDLPGLGEQQLEVLSPSVSMADDKIKISGTLVTAGASADTGVPLTIAGKISLKGDDRVVLENMTVESADIIEPQKFAAFIEQLLNPLVNLQRFDRRNMAIRLNTLQVSEGFVEARGKLLLAPRQPSTSSAKVAVKKP